MVYRPAFLSLLAVSFALACQLEAKPPAIESTNPAVGASDVDPNLNKITVTFDQDMAPGFSWTGGGPEFPKTTGKPEWVTSRTCTLPVTLEPAKYYRVGINSTSHQNFRSVEGQPTQPRAIYFTTVGADAELQAKLIPPTVARFEPSNGATDVDPATTSIVLTFSRKMGGGRSLTGGGETFPEITGEITWDPTGTIITVPVKLKPGQQYQMGVNSPSHRNFSSAEGVAVEPVVYTFKTRP